jgi:hypothetical protein
MMLQSPEQLRPFRFWKVRFFASAWLQSLFSRNRQGWINAGIDSLKRSTNAYSKVKAGVFDSCKVLSVDSYWNKTSAILSALLRNSCPSAIFRGVVFVWVKFINGVSTLWAWPHVFKKCRKVVSPSFANPDASATPVWKIFVIAVIAPAFHAKPSLVLNRAAVLSFVSVLYDTLNAFLKKLTVFAHVRSPFLCKASAGLCSFVARLPKIAACCVCNIPAIANALPHFRRGVFFQDQKSAKFLACDVDKLHGYILNGS